MVVVLWVVEIVEAAAESGKLRDIKGLRSPSTVVNFSNCRFTYCVDSRIDLNKPSRGTFVPRLCLEC